MQGIVWILFFYLLGCVVAALTGNFIPGSVVGMLLLFAALSFGWIRPWRMKRAAGFLLDNMMLFFIPVGVGLIASYSLVSKYLTAILVASIVSTVLVIVVVGIVEQKLEAKKGDDNDSDSSAAQPSETAADTPAGTSAAPTEKTSTQQMFSTQGVAPLNGASEAAPSPNRTDQSSALPIAGATSSASAVHTDSNKPEETAAQPLASTKPDSHE